MRADPVRQVLDPGHSLVAAFGDDVGRAEVEGELLAGFVPAHRDDPFGAELLGGEHAEQPDGAVIDDRDGLARPGLGGHGGEPAGARHVAMSRWGAAIRIVVATAGEWSTVPPGRARTTHQPVSPR